MDGLAAVIVGPDQAALPSYGPGGSATVRFVDLRTGAERTAAISLEAQWWTGLAWSPDGRWLFLATASGAVQAMNPRTGQVSGLGFALPPVTFLAIQGAP